MSAFAAGSDSRLLLLLLLGLRLREVLDAVQPKQFEEALGGAVEDGAAGLFGAAGDLDQVLFHEAADRLAAGHSADGFDVGAEDRLLVSDDGQSLYGRLGELGVDFLLVELLEQVAEFRDRENLESAGHLLDAEAAVTGGVDLVYLLDGLADRAGDLHFSQLRQSSG